MSEQTTTKSEPSGVAALSRKPVEILLVDDNRNWTDATAEYLCDEGFSVTTAIDGIEALSRMKTCHPDVMVLDINMPRLSGIEVLSAMKATGIDIPVILVTAKPEDYPEETISSIGASTLLAKPIAMDVLVDIIQQLTDVQHKLAD